MFVIQWGTLWKAAAVVMLAGFSCVYTFGGGPAQLNVFLNKNAMIPVQAVVTEENRTALTFDVTLGTDYTAEILDALRKHQVKATFFLTGAWIEKNETKCQQILNAGHEIGNHSDQHIDMTKLNREGIVKEIGDCDKKLKAVFGKSFNATYFRPPFGEYNTEVIKVAEQLGMKCVLGDLQPLNEMPENLELVTEKFVKKTKNGAIAVLQTGADGMVQLMDKLILELKRQGTELCTLSELLTKQQSFVDRVGRVHPLH